MYLDLLHAYFPPLGDDSRFSMNTDWESCADVAGNRAPTESRATMKRNSNRKHMRGPRRINIVHVSWKKDLAWRQLSYKTRNCTKHRFTYMNGNRQYDLMGSWALQCCLKFMSSVRVAEIFLF